MGQLRRRLKTLAAQPALDPIPEEPFCLVWAAIVFVYLITMIPHCLFHKLQRLVLHRIQ